MGSSIGGRSCTSASVDVGFKLLVFLTFYTSADTTTTTTIVVVVVAMSTMLGNQLDKIDSAKLLKPFLDLDGIPREGQIGQEEFVLGCVGRLEGRGF